MDFTAPHTGFVLASYVISAVILFGLVSYIWWRGRSANARLRELEARGYKRRTGASATGSETA